MFFGLTGNPVARDSFPRAEIRPAPPTHPFHSFKQSEGSVNRTKDVRKRRRRLQRRIESGWSSKASGDNGMEKLRPGSVRKPGSLR